MYCVYKITNNINNKVYIGQTKRTLKDRLKRHFNYADNGYQFKLSRAIRKYGKDNFSITKIESSNNFEDILTKEIKWIKYFNSLNQSHGYNMTEGGEGGNTFIGKTEEEMKSIGKKISKNLRGSKNGNSTPVNMKNILTGEVIRFGSGVECNEFLSKELHSFPFRIYYRNATKNRNYGIQTLFNEKYVFFYDGDNIGRVTKFTTRQGVYPQKITNLKTGEEFVGISKEECLEYFNLSKYKNKRGNVNLSKYGYTMKRFKKCNNDNNNKQVIEKVLK